MKLAEALARRADIQTRLHQLKQRALQEMRVQEGDMPEEDPQELINEYTALSEELADLVAAINRVNSSTRFDDTMSIADALAQREQLLKRQQFFQELADRAGERAERYSRSEIKYVSTVSVLSLRRQADDAARRYRDVDLQLQQKNWTTDFPEVVTLSPLTFRDEES